MKCALNAPLLHLHQIATEADLGSLGPKTLKQGMYTVFGSKEFEQRSVEQSSS